MKIILLMIAGSLTLGIFFLIAFLWSVRSKQYEDETKSASSILWDDEPNPKK